MLKLSWCFEVSRHITLDFSHHLNVLTRSDVFPSFWCFMSSICAQESYFESLGKVVDVVAQKKLYFRCLTEISNCPLFLTWLFHCLVNANQRLVHTIIWSKFHHPDWKSSWLICSLLLHRKKKKKKNLKCNLYAQRWTAVHIKFVWWNFTPLLWII